VRLDPDNPYYPDNFGLGRKTPIVCISKIMSKYAYQIKGALENAQGQFIGLQVLVCDPLNFEIVNVPAKVLDRETTKFMQYRLKLTDVIDIQRLPIPIQNKIRAPLGRWLDYWVVKNFNGNFGKRESTNP
jgi:hypothetical protein